jgi:hypothetical protein
LLTDFLPRAGIDPRPWLGWAAGRALSFLETAYRVRGSKGYKMLLENIRKPKNTKKILK